MEEGLFWRILYCRVRHIVMYSLATEAEKKMLLHLVQEKICLDLRAGNHFLATWLAFDYQPNYAIGESGVYPVYVLNKRTKLFHCWRNRHGHGFSILSFFLLFRLCGTVCVRKRLVEVRVCWGYRRWEFTALATEPFKDILRRCRIYTVCVTLLSAAVCISRLIFSYILTFLHSFWLVLFFPTQYFFFFSSYFSSNSFFFSQQNGVHLFVL